MKRVLSLLIVCTMIFSLCGCGLGESKNLSVFHEKLTESQELLDSVADTIYTNWYDAIYEDEFNGDIDQAILAAQIDHSDDLEQIEALDAEIGELFGKLKDGKNGDLVKDVMSAYSDYYEFVVNVSGSFNTYSADKETLKKEFASILKDLSYEL